MRLVRTDRITTSLTTDHAQTKPGSDADPRLTGREQWARLAQNTATLGFVLYSIFAPHSIAAAEIALAIAGAGWLVRSLATGQAGFRRMPFDETSGQRTAFDEVGVPRTRFEATGVPRTRFDLVIWFFFLWTVASSFLSEEPRISIAKIQSACVFLLFYLTQAVVTRRTAAVLVAVMILSGAAGTVYSLYDLARGRGVLIESLAPESPFRQLGIREGDAVWRVGERRVYSVNDIDNAIRSAPPEAKLSISLISQGEHLERPGLTVSDAARNQPSPSGVTGSKATHRFRASGWTRHYETYSEILQILAQLALGLAVANFKNHGFNRRSKLASAAFALLALGIALTAMRTVLLALVVGVAVISVRALGRRAKVLSLAGLCLLLAFGAFVIYQTRARHALSLGDPSSTLRVQVARVGLGRMMLHPLFGHGMDAMHVHWQEWGFPGKDLLHLHSTPLQLAFDRGLPALGLWLWLMWLFWRSASRDEQALRDSSDTNRYGILLGATGAVAGFFASSLVNYNFGDGEVALVFWWLLGIVVVLTGTQSSKTV